MSNLTEVKRVKNCVLLKDATGYRYLKLERVRLSFPRFGTPGEQEDDDGQKSKAWGGKALLPKETHTEARELIRQVILALMKDNKVEGKIPQERWFLKDGDDDGRPEEEKGHFTVAFSDKKKRPTVRLANGEKIDPDESGIEKIDNLFYGGCWGSLLLRPWFFDGRAKGKSKEMPKRISCGFQTVQFIKDDTPFGNARPEDDDHWGDESGDGGGDGLDDDDSDI